MKSLAISILALMIWGCGDSFQKDQQRWSASTPGAQEFTGYGSFEPQITELKMNTSEQKIGSEKLLRTSQKIEGFDVEGTWFQEVTDKEGKIQSYNYQLVDGIPDSVIHMAKEMKVNKELLIKQAKADYAILKKSPEIISSKVVLEADELSSRAWLKVEFLSPDEQSVITFYLNAAGRVKKSEKYQHNFTDGVGFVYYSSPEESELSEQLLKNLNGDGVLGSDHLKVESALKPTPSSLDHVFKINTSDKEFDLLQSYFFVDQTITWFKEELNTELGYPLNIKVHVGGLKPTNAAFFYAGNIRLGEGDGQIYQKIPRDPSIVSHEAGHAYVEKLSGLAFEGEAGSYSEAFSDFFTAARLGRSEMGFFSYMKAPFKRNIDNNMRADRDLLGKKYNDSLVISGTFWELKKLLGTEKSIQLAKSFLVELGPGGKFKDLPEVLTSVARKILPSEDHHVVESVLEQKGWRNL